MTSSTVEEALKPRRCPTCNSHNPALHPAVQHGGEVSICPNAWHGELDPRFRRPLPIEAQGGESVGWRPTCDLCHKALTEPGSLLFGAPNDEGLSKKTHICATCALTRPEPSLGSREARKPLKPWNEGDSAGLILALEHHMDQQDEAWPRGSAPRSPLASVLDEAAEHIRALSSLPSLGMEGVREALSPAEDLILADSYTRASIIYGPLSRDCLIELLAERDAILGRALASISTPSGEVIEPQQPPDATAARRSLLAVLDQWFGEQPVGVVNLDPDDRRAEMLGPMGWLIFSNRRTGPPTNDSRFEAESAYFMELSPKGVEALEEYRIFRLHALPSGEVG